MKDQTEYFAVRYRFDFGFLSLSPNKTWNKINLIFNFENKRPITGEHVMTGFLIAASNT